METVFRLTHRRDMTDEERSFFGLGRNVAQARTRRPAAPMPAASND